MGNIWKKFSQQPQTDSTPKIECPICYLPSRQFKRLHKKQDGQLSHFACIPCRNELFKYWNQPDCPICVTPIYTISNCQFFPFDSCKEVKKLSTCHSHIIDLHKKNQFGCSV